MIDIAGFRMLPLTVTSGVADELALLDAPSYERFRTALDAAEEALRAEAGKLPRDGNLIVSIRDVNFLIRFHYEMQRYYVSAFFFEFDHDPDPRDPTPAAQIPNDWTGGTVLPDDGAEIRTVVSKPRGPKAALDPTGRRARQPIAPPRAIVLPLLGETDRSPFPASEAEMGSPAPGASDLATGSSERPGTTFGAPPPWTLPCSFSPTPSRAPSTLWRTEFMIDVDLSTQLHAKQPRADLTSLAVWHGTRGGAGDGLHR